MEVVAVMGSSIGTAAAAASEKEMMMTAAAVQATTTEVLIGQVQGDEMTIARLKIN